MITRLHKILVANRGEIALRVIRAGKRLGYRMVAVHSSVDAAATFVREADQAVEIGPGPAKESYLSIPRLLDAARRTGADAIHPGYGFLSENADFAEQCIAAGLIFIGPSPNAIRLMGNKRAAKACAENAGVPCVPGYDGESQDHDTLLRHALQIGFPLMVKAVAGGGGEGVAPGIPGGRTGGRAWAGKKRGIKRLREW